MESSDTSRPKISVVIASVNGPEHLDGCLAALAQQTVREQMEVIIADSCGEPVTQVVRVKYPWVRLMSFADPKPVPELRALGVREAHGEIIAITEDHCLAPPSWCAEILRAHGERRGIIGGAVENHPSLTRVLDWATFFCEYARFMQPVPDGPAEYLPGNNISYRRDDLARIGAVLAEGIYWEDKWNARLQEKGIQSYSDPKVEVSHRMRFGLSEFLSQRYHYSRSYAGIRLAHAAAWKRAAYAGACVVLPAVLLWRILSEVWRKRCHRTELMRSVPLLLLFMLVWACGEFVGSLAGAGDSLLRVR